ncbi:hypothetical protein JCM8547_006919 [Rhodosporidiobolus lusitaniae]
MTPVDGRPLGLYERFSLARSNSGQAPIVAFTAVLPAPASTQAVQGAVDSLLARFPLLRCTIADSATTRPRYLHREELSAAQIVVEGSVAPEEGPQAALEAALEAGRVCDVEQGPLWRVWVSREGNKQRLTLAVHHTVCDGTATRNLFSELLRLIKSPEPVDNDAAVVALCPSLEDTVHCRLSPLEVAKVVLDEVVVPNLPSFLRPAPPPLTLLNPPLIPPGPQPSTLRLLFLAPSVVSGLKTAGKSHGVNTLHPILYTAALAALSSSSPDTSSNSQIVGSTPFSCRLPSHPLTTGNYVAGYTASKPLPALLPGRFWSFCAEYGRTISAPETKQRAQRRMGMLGFIPDGELPAGEGKPARTKWEGWVEEQLEKNRFGETFEVSNLGVLPSTGWEEEGLEEVFWCQTGSAFVAAFELNPVAVRNGSLTFTLSYRKNAIAEETVDRFWTSYERLLKRIAENGIDEKATFQDLKTVSN